MMIKKMIPLKSHGQQGKMAINQLIQISKHHSLSMKKKMKSSTQHGDGVVRKTKRRTHGIVLTSTHEQVQQIIISDQVIVIMLLLFVLMVDITILIFGILIKVLLYQLKNVLNLRRTSVLNH